jgi:acetyl esterase/lipase
MNRGSKDLLPAVVLVHGGGYTKNDKFNAREQNISMDLAKAGYTVMSINY